MVSVVVVFLVQVAMVGLMPTKSHIDVVVVLKITYIIYSLRSNSLNGALKDTTMVDKFTKKRV